MTSDTNEPVLPPEHASDMTSCRAAIIVTGNAVEAIDIAEALRLRSDADPRHFLTIEAALDWIEHARTTPLCLVFGFRVADGPARRCIARAQERGVPVLLVTDAQPPGEVSVAVQRPFSGETLEAALARIGL